MKRFLLFEGAVYYPGGGMEDFNSDFDTLEAAIEKVKSMPEYLDKYSWQHIYDQVEKIEVWNNGN